MPASIDTVVRSSIVLASLTACAFFTARAATTVLSSELIEQHVGASTAQPAQARLPAMIRRRHDPSLILQRNIFDSARGQISVAGPAEPEPAQSDDLADVQTASPCDSDLRLVGTVVIPGAPDQSFAAIAGADRKTSPFRHGAEVGDSTIRAIGPDSVILQNEDRLCRLAMFEIGRRPPQAKPRVTQPTARSATRRPRRGPRVDRNAGLSDAEITGGIEKLNDTNYNVSRAMLNKVLDNAGKLIGIAAVAPKMQGGSSTGLEIRGVRPNTLLTKLGIQNGDVLESVNGQSLTSTDAALGAYTTLRTADKFNLAIRRGGRSVILNYNLQ